VLGITPIHGKRGVPASDFAVSLLKRGISEPLMCGGYIDRGILAANADRDIKVVARG
jgi:hypothetical protein